MRLYTLFPTRGGRFSNMSAEYDGTAYHIVAGSIRQAYAVAYKRSWTTGPGQVGIVQVYRRGGFIEAEGGGWHQLWCGCFTHDGLNLQHGASAAATAREMETHVCAAPSGPLLSEWELLIERAGL